MDPKIQLIDWIFGTIAALLLKSSFPVEEEAVEVSSENDMNKWIQEIKANPSSISFIWTQVLFANDKDLVG